MSSLPWSSKTSKADPVSADQLMILDSEDSNEDTKNKLITLGSIEGTGEDNTSSNSGVGAGLAQSKVGVDLPFKSLLGETSRIILTENTNDVTFTLGSVVVTTDQPNVYGAFPQVFQSDEICIETPTTGNLYHFVGNDLTADRNITFPLLLTDDIFVFENFTQTLSNKTLSTPTIANFTNANHNHSTIALGGQIGSSALITETYTAITGLGVQTIDLDMGGNDILNSILPTNVNFFVDNIDSTKVLGFDISTFTTSSTRTITVPDADITLVNTSDGNITNSNLTSGVFSNITGVGAQTQSLDINGQTITNTGILTLPSTTTTLIGTDTTDILTNKTFDANGTGNVLSNVDVADLADGTPGELITWDNTNAPDTVATGTSGQVLTSNGAGLPPTFETSAAGEVFTWTANHDANGFSLVDPQFADDTDITKILNVDLSAMTTAITLTLSSAQSTAQILSIPNITTGDVLVTQAFAQTLTNKTMSGSSNTFSDIAFSSLADGTAGELITWDASNVIDTVSTGTSGQVLTSNGAGTAPTFQAASVGTQTPWTQNIDGAEFNLSNVGVLNLKIDNTTANIELEANHSTPTNNQVIGNIDFVDDNSVASREIYSRIQSQIQSPTSGSEDGELHFDVMESGTLTNYLEMNPAFAAGPVTFKVSTVFNSGIVFGNAVFSIIPSANILTYDAPTVSGHDFRIDDVVEYSYRAGSADFNNNSLINATIDGDLNTVLDINETQMDVSVGTSGFVLTSNGPGIPPTYQVTGAAGQTPWGSNIDGAGFNLSSVGEIQILDTVANTSGILSIEATHTVPADGDLIGQIDFIDDDNNVPTRTIYSQIKSLIQDPTDTTEAGELILSVIDNGTLTDYLTLNDAGNNRVTFNVNAQVGTNNLYFNDTNTGFIQSSSDIQYDVATGGSHVLRVNDVAEYTFSGTDLTFTAGNNLVIQASGATGFIDIGEITTPANPAADVGRLYVKDETSTTTLFFRDSAGVETNLLAVGGAQTPWTSDIDADGFDLTDLSLLEFRSSTDIAPAGTVRTIYYDDAQGMIFNALTGDFFQWEINAVAQMRLDTTQLQLASGQNLTLNDDADIQWGGSADRKIKNTTGGFEFEVETGDTFNFTIQDTTEYTFSATDITFTAGNNLVLQASGATGFIDIGEITTPAAPGATVGRVYTKDVSGSAHLFIQDDTTETDLNLGAEFFGPWTSDHDAGGFDLLNVGGITISNPADTFQYIITPAAIVADRILNLPLMTGTDTFALVDFAQTLTNKTLTAPVIATITNIGTLTLPTSTDTLVGRATTDTFTNKTIDGDVNTLSDIAVSSLADGTDGELITWDAVGAPATVATGTSGQVLTSNGAGTAPTFQAAGGGSQTPWLSNIDADGFDLQDLSNLEFRETTGLPASTVPYIAHEATGITVNVPTSDTLNIDVNAVNEYSFSATEADFTSNNLSNVGILHQLVDDTTAVHEMEANHTTPANAQIIGQTDYIDDDSVGGRITYAQTRAVIEDPTTTTADAEYFISVLKAGVLTDYISINEANNDSISFSKELVMNTNDITGVSILQFSDNILHEIHDDVSSIFVDVPTGNSIVFRVNTTPEYTFAAGTSDWTLNNLTSMGILSFADTTTSLQQSSTDLQYDVNTGGSHVLRVGDATEYTFDATAADFGTNNITNVTNLTLAGDLALSTNQQITWAASTNRAIQNQDSGFFFKVETSDTFKFQINAVDEYDFDSLRADWNSNNITEMGSLAFDSLGTTAGITIANIFSDVSGIKINVPTGDDVRFTINGVEEYDFQSTRFRLNTNFIDEVGNITFTDTGTAVSAGAVGIFADSSDMKCNVSSGRFFRWTVNNAEILTLNTTILDFSGVSIQLDTGNSIRFDGATNTQTIIGSAAGITLDIPTADSFLIDINSVTEYDFSATVANFNGNNLQDVANILDSNGNELLIFTTTASAVNELTIVNAATATPVEIQASGETNVDVQFTPKGTGTFYGNRETWAWPLTDESTAPTTGVKYTTEPAPYDMSIEDAIAGLTVAGTGAALFTIDVLKEDTAPNTNTFTTIFSTKPTIDASEFTSTTAATAPVISVSTWEKGRRLQLSIDTLDTDTLARGAKISLITHATAK